MLVAVPAGVLAILAVMIGVSRSNAAPRTTATAPTATPIAASDTPPASTGATTTTNPQGTGSTATTSTATTTGPSAATAEPPNTGATATPADLRAPSAHRETEPRPATSGAREGSPTTPDRALGGFGVTAEPPPSSSSSTASGAGNRTWHRPDELKLTMGNDSVDIAAPSAFHTGADVPVLYVGGRKHTASTFVSPNVIRFTGVGAITPGDEIAIAYGKGTPTVLRKGAR